MEPPINFYTGSSEKDKRDLSRNPEKKGLFFYKEKYKPDQALH